MTVTFDLSPEEVVMVQWAAREQGQTANELIASTVRDYLGRLRGRFVTSSRVRAVEVFTQLPVEQQELFIEQMKKVIDPPVEEEEEEKL